MSDGEDIPDRLDIPPEERAGPEETPEIPGVNSEPDDTDDTGIPITLRDDAHANVHETERCDGAGSDACIRDDPELSRERDTIHVTNYGPGHSKSGRRVLCGECRDKQTALNIADDPPLARMYQDELGDLRERFPDILGDVDLPVTDGGSEQVVVATGCSANSKRFHRDSGDGVPECRYGNKDNLDWTDKTVNSIHSFYSPCGYCYPDGHDEYQRLTGNTEDRLMTDGGTDFPLFTWEVFGQDGDGGGAAYLFRRTQTTKKPVFAFTGRNGSGVDHRRLFSVDPEWSPGGREFREADHSETVRDVFLAAVKAAFVRGPSPHSREELRAIRDPLTWYELEALDALRDGRNDGRRPDDGQDSPALPSEAWDLIKHARSEITLSEWTGPTNPETKATTEDAALDRFTDGGVDGEREPDDHSMGGVMEMTAVYCPTADETYGPADGAESGMAFCPYCGEQSDHAGHEAHAEIAEVSCPATTNATYRYCPGCGNPLDGGDE